MFLGHSAFMLSVNMKKLTRKSLYIWKLRIMLLALAAVAQCIECQPANQRVSGLIPSQGTCLGCGPGPWLGAHDTQPTNVSHIDDSLPLFLSPFPSL